MQIAPSDSKWQSLIRYVHESRMAQQATATALYVIHGDKTLVDWREGTGEGPNGESPITDQARFNVYSIRKSYLAIAAALAIHEGKLADIDVPVRQYIEGESKYQHVSPTLTIRHLVTHTHGLEFREGNILHTFEPGTDWMYNNIGVELLCRLIWLTTGEHVADYVRNKVLRPLGCIGSDWATKAASNLVWDQYAAGHPPHLELGTPTGEYRNLFVTPAELARFAWLHLRHGTAEERQIVPRAVIDRVTTCASPEGLSVEHPRHGYFWWLNRRPSRTEIGHHVPAGAYQIAGMNGSMCLVIPELDAVVVRMLNKVYAPAGYNRLEDFHTLGNLATACLS
jgi:CubicO group peptidase (beta-lactamase class C family)